MLKLKNDAQNIQLLTSGTRQSLAWDGSVLFSAHRAQMTFSGQSETKSVTLVTEERDQHYTLTPLAQLTCRILPWIGDKPEIYTIFCIKA